MKIERSNFDEVRQSYIAATVKQRGNQTPLRGTSRQKRTVIYFLDIGDIQEQLEIAGVLAEFDIERGGDSGGIEVADKSELGLCVYRSVSRTGTISTWVELCSACWKQRDENRVNPIAQGCRKANGETLQIFWVIPCYCE